MLKAASEALSTPSETVMLMLLKLPWSPTPGVPLSLPVFVSKVAHAGLPLMEKVNASPFASAAEGWNA